MDETGFTNIDWIYTGFINDRAGENARGKGDGRMNLIVAVDRNWAIGKDNRLMHHIPADMKYFREMTKGGVVVMGRKTLESFPQGQPLKNRVNIVISRRKDYKVKGAVVVHSRNRRGGVEKVRRRDLCHRRGEHLPRDAGVLRYGVCDED